MMLAVNHKLALAKTKVDQMKLIGLNSEEICNIADIVENAVASVSAMPTENESAV